MHTLGSDVRVNDKLWIQTPYETLQTYIRSCERLEHPLNGFLIS